MLNLNAEDQNVKGEDEAEREILAGEKRSWELRQ